MLGGTPELLAQLRALARDLEDRAAPAAVTAGLDVLRSGVNRRTPRLTGALVSAEVETEPKDRRNYVSGTVTVSSGHAAAVEFGTHDQAAEPYMRPAADEDGPAAADAVGLALGAALDAL